MSNNNGTTPGVERKNAKWGTWWVAAIVVAAICVAIIYYIGWFDNQTHVDSPNGDNVIEQYDDQTAQPQSPGVNDWQNPDQQDLDEVVVEHATTEN